MKAKMKMVGMLLFGMCITLAAKADIKCWVLADGGLPVALAPIGAASSPLLKASIGEVNAYAILASESPDKISDLQLEDTKSGFKIMGVSFDLTQKSAKLAYQAANKAVSLDCVKE